MVALKRGFHFSSKEVNFSRIIYAVSALKNKMTVNYGVR